jgi:hypothetical protein
MVTPYQSSWYWVTCTLSNTACMPVAGASSISRPAAPAA